MTKIALIYPATDFDMKHHRSALPNGLLMLSSVLKQNGYSVDIYDRRHTAELPESPDEYDVIGFTAMTMQIKYALELLKKIMHQGYKGKVIFGGPHASVNPQHLLQIKDINTVFIGEAENTILDYMKDPKDGIFQPTKYVEDLDTLPFPDREPFRDVIERERFINIFSTRGCPFNCKFCQPTKRILFGKKVRMRSVDNLIQEIEDAVIKYGITTFSIDDDTFTFKKSYLLDFCKKIKKYHLLWTCQSRTDIGADTLEIMRDSGFWEVAIGVESGSQRVLELMGKHNTVENNMKFIKTCNSLGIRTFCNIILGYPGETLEDMELTYQFIMQAQPTLACVSQATPFFGTELYNENVDNIIPMDYDAVARHIHRAKFISMSPLQDAINEYVKICSVGWDKPLEPDPNIFPPHSISPQLMIAGETLEHLLVANDMEQAIKEKERFINFSLLDLAMDQHVLALSSGETEIANSLQKVIEQIEERLPERVLVKGDKHWMCTNLDQNKYGNAHPGSIYHFVGNQLIFSPTSPQDHLATPFYGINERYCHPNGEIHVTIKWHHSKKYSTFPTIIIQDQDYMSLTVIKSDGHDLDQFVPLNIKSKRVRLVFISDDGERCVLPNYFDIFQTLNALK